MKFLFSYSTLEETLRLSARPCNIVYNYLSTVLGKLTLLVFSTITTVSIWCGFKFVDVERTTVAHLYICTIKTTGTTITTRIAKTYFPRDYAILNWRMASLQPSCIWSIAIAVSITTTCGHLFAWYKPVPSFSQIVVILTSSWRREAFPSGVVIYGPVRLAFRLFCTCKNKQTDKGQQNKESVKRIDFF